MYTEGVPVYMYICIYIYIIYIYVYMYRYVFHSRGIGSLLHLENGDNAEPTNAAQMSSRPQHINEMSGNTRHTSVF